MNDLMIDIETLDTEETAVIVQIAIIAFDIETFEVQRTYSYVGNAQDQYTRSVSYDTLKWWLDQPPEVVELLKLAFDPAESYDTDTLAMHVGSALEVESNFGVRHIWTQGVFDLPITKNFLAQSSEFEYPFKYYQEKDLRTVQSMCAWLGYDTKAAKAAATEGLTAHNAYDDCLAQIKLLKTYMGWLKK
jgi:hypothetical protein